MRTKTAVIHRSAQSFVLEPIHFAPYSCRDNHFYLPLKPLYISHMLADTQSSSHVFHSLQIIQLQAVCGGTASAEIIGASSRLHLLRNCLLCIRSFSVSGTSAIQAAWGVPCLSSLSSEHTWSDLNLNTFLLVERNIYIGHPISVPVIHTSHLYRQRCQNLLQTHTLPETGALGARERCEIRQVAWSALQCPGEQYAGGPHSA